MKDLELVYTKEYVLLIDKRAEIKEGNIAIHDFGMGYDLEIPCDKDNLNSNTRKLVVAYHPLTKEAKELDLPELPPFEVDIEKLACEKYSIKEGLNDYDERYYNSHNVAKAEAFIEGYKAAQSKGQYSLEDMKKAIEMAREQSEPYYGGGGLVLSEPIYENKYTEEEIIQSLSTQQLPKEFIISDKFSTFEENIKYGEYKW